MKTVFEAPGLAMNPSRGGSNGHPNLTTSFFAASFTRLLHSRPLENGEQLEYRNIHLQQGILKWRNPYTSMVKRTSAGSLQGLRLLSDGNGRMSTGQRPGYLGEQPHDATALHSLRNDRKIDQLETLSISHALDQMHLAK